MSKLTLFILLIVSAAILGMAAYMRVNKPASTEKTLELLKNDRRIIIDVRTPEEFQSGHLIEATNLPKDEIENRIASVVPDKQTPVLLYCRSGARSGAALEILHRLGYENAVNLGAYETARRIVEEQNRTVQ